MALQTLISMLISEIMIALYLEESAQDLSDTCKCHSASVSAFRVLCTVLLITAFEYIG